MHNITKLVGILNGWYHSDVEEDNPILERYEINFGASDLVVKEDRAYIREDKESFDEVVFVNDMEGVYGSKDLIAPNVEALDHICAAVLIQLGLA